MGKEYEVKKAIEEQLSEVVMSEALKERIRQECKPKARYDWYHILCNKVAAKVAACSIGIACLFGGAAYAVNHVGGLDNLIEELGFDALVPYIQDINKVDTKVKVSLVVEQAVPADNNVIYTVSLIKAGDTHGEEGTHIEF